MFTFLLFKVEVSHTSQLVHSLFYLQDVATLGSYSSLDNHAVVALRAYSTACGRAYVGHGTDACGGDISVDFLGLAFAFDVRSLA